MAEQERKTKAQRREEKRQRRMEEEAAAAAAARRRSFRNGTIATVLVVVLGGLGWLAVDNQTPTIDDAITVSAEEVEASREASGCDVLEVTPIESREHFDPATAPLADVLYTQGRPTATGPHYSSPGPIFSGVRDGQLDERSIMHNLEHGSLIIWFDPEQLAGEAVDAIDSLVSTLNDAGFDENQGRAGILASPYTDPGIDSGKAVALRAWGQAMDCEEWNEDYAHGWIAAHFGSRGRAPEAAIGRYPEDVLEITDESGADEEAPADDTTEEPADDASASADATVTEGEG